MSEFIQDMRNIGTNAFEECGTGTEAAEEFINQSIDGSSWITWPAKVVKAFAETHGNNDPGDLRVSELSASNELTVYDLMTVALFEKAREIATEAYTEASK